MLDIRLRLADDNGNPGRVIETLSLSWTGYSSQTVKFAVSEKISGQLDAPFLVIAEYATSRSGPWKRVPRNDLFIVDEDSADSVDTSGAVTFTATGMLPWLAARYPLWWRPGDSADLERGYAGRTAGYILRDLIESAKTVQGWGPNVTLGFTDPIDSAGQKWTEAVSQAWPLFTTTLGRVIQSLTEQGYMEWWSEGFQLKAVNPGTGADRSNTVTLGGPGFSRAPAARKFDPATAIVVQYELGWTHFDNPGAETRFGKLYKVMSQSGAKTRAAAEKNTQPALTEARAMQEELSYEWELSGDGVPVPWESFQVGDVVTARTRRGTKVLRVIGIDVSKDANGLVKATAVVGSKLLNLQAKLAKRSAAASVGQIIGGSGAALPPAGAPAKAAPVPPTALRVASNTGSWGEDGTERSSVTIAWDGVSQAVDGFGVDVDSYEVWSRRASETMALLTRTAALSTTVTTWTPGEDRYVTVRARSRAGVWSEFAPEISVTPTRPVSIVPKTPTGLAIASNVGAFAADGAATATVRVTWAAVTQSTADLPLTVGAYRAELEDGQVWVELAETTGLEATFTVPTGKTRRVRVRARSGLGVWGDPSAPLSVTGANPAQVSTAASVPVLAAGMGLVTVTWDGKLVGGANPPASFQLLYAETAPAASGPWTRAAGSPARAAGQVATIKGAAGSTVFVRFVWIDTLGRISSASTVASVAVTPVGGGDIDKTITDALDQAGQKATAAGQTAEKAVQDALEARQAAGTAQTTAEAARDSAIAAARNAENKVVNGTFERGTEGWDVSGLTLDPSGGREGTAALVSTGTGTALQPAVTVTPGQRWRLEFWYRTDGTQAGATLVGGLRIQRWNGTAWSDAAFSTTTVVGDWTRQAIDYVVPEGVTRIRTRLAWAYSGGVRLWFDDVRLYDVTQIVALEAAAQAAQDTATKAERDAATAQEKADQAASAASAAQGKADSAASAAAAAQGRADSAFANARTAQDAAEAAAARAAAMLASAENKIADPSMSLGQWAPVGGWAVATDKGRTDSTSLTKGGQSTTASTVVLSTPGSTTAITMPVEPGQVLEVGGWYCTSADWNGSASNSKLRFANQSNGLIGPTNGIPTAREEWTRTSGRYTVPANGSVTGVRLNVVSDHTTGRVWWDDFFLRDITAAVKAETDAAAAAEAARVAQAAADAAAKTAADALAKAGTAQETAEAAVSSASGRNALYHAVTGPSGLGTRAGDIWHQWSTLSGSEGRLLATWRWTGSAWAKTQLDEKYIPLLDIGSGTYGLMRGDRLESFTVTTEKLLVGNLSNLVADPALTLPVGVAYTSVVGSDSSWSIVDTTGLPGRALTMKATSSTGQHRLKSRERAQVNPGEKYAIAARARVTLTSGARPLIRLVWRTATGTFISNSGSVNLGSASGGSWETTSGIFTVPEGATIATAEWEIEVPSSFVGELWVGSPMWRAAATGQVIVDGDITGRHVAARSFTGEHMQLGSLSVDLVEPAFGQNLDLIGNGAISLVTSVQSELQQNLAQARDDLAATEARAADAARTAGAAQSGVSTAQQQVEQVRSAQAATQASLAQTQAYFRFANGEAIIGRTDSPSTMHLRNTGLEIREEGVPVMWVNAKQIHVPSLVTTTVVLGNHQLVREGSRTVMRYVEPR